MLGRKIASHGFLLYLSLVVKSCINSLVEVDLDNTGHTMAEVMLVGR
jgi:hypothetical protein